jgi:hypothetical protein
VIRVSWLLGITDDSVPQDYFNAYGRTPGPITTDFDCCGKYHSDRLKSRGRGVWVPAFAGTTSYNT